MDFFECETPRARYLDTPTLCVVGWVINLTSKERSKQNNINNERVGGYIYSVLREAIRVSQRGGLVLAFFFFFSVCKSPEPSSHPYNLLPRASPNAYLPAVQLLPIGAPLVGLRSVICARYYFDLLQWQP